MLPALLCSVLDMFWKPMLGLCRYVVAGDSPGYISC